MQVDRDCPSVITIINENKTHMVDETNLQQIKNLVDTAQNSIIVFSPRASLDQKAVATSLYLALVRAQKTVRLITPQLITTEQDVLAGLSDTQTELGHQNLCLSFDYNPEQVDKVSYHIGEQTGKFYLTIKPKIGVSPLDAQNVEFSYTGASADLIFAVGINNLESLEQLYFGYEDMYRDTAIISINTFETSFGTVKIDTGSASSVSEIVAQLIPQLGLSLDGDSATNLLLGIESATQNLTSLSATAETFETVASLLRSGARRVLKAKQQNGWVEESQPVLAKPGSQNLPLMEGEIVGEVYSERQVEEIKKDVVSKSKKNSKKTTSEPPQGYTPDRRI